MNYFGKVLRHVLIFSLCFSIFTYSNSAKAAAGLAVASPFVVTAGLVVGGAGLGSGIITVAKAQRCKDPLDALFKYLIGGIVTAAILGVGFIILDGEQTVQYGPLSVQDAAGLGISENARDQYNAEIDQVNALVGHVDAELAHMDKATVEDSAAVWGSVKDAVTVQTFQVMQAVTAQLYK